MTKDSALKLALEALERGETELRWKAITAIKEALAQPEQEPVAWYDKHGMITHDPFEGIKPLYTTPPQRTWQGLTDEEYSQLHDGLYQQGKSLGWVVDQVEAKLIERNV